MLLIPAIRIQAGKAIGADGAPRAEKPEEIAARLADAGARRFQIVDMDSFNGEKPGALDVIERCARRLDGAGVQVATGVKDDEHVQSHLDAGAHWLVLGHRAASAPHVLKDLCLEYPGHIIIGMNVRNGRMTGDAHSKLANHDIVDLAGHFQSDGVHGIVYQDVDEAGEPLAPNAESARAVAGAVSVEVFMAGRIDSLAALEVVCGLADTGVAGIVVNGGFGKQQGDLDFAAANRLLEAAR